MLVFSPLSLISQLAKLEAGCAIERPAGADTIPECTHKIHGMKPSSLLSTYAVIVGMAAAVLMPICGAMVDTTPHRLGLGRALSGLLVLGTFSTIFVSQTNYFAMSIAFAFVVFVGLFEAMTLYAYLPELTNDEATLNRYTSARAVVCKCGYCVVHHGRADTRVSGFGLVAGASDGGRLSIVHRHGEGATLREAHAICGLPDDRVGAFGEGRATGLAAEQRGCSP